MLPSPRTPGSPMDPLDPILDPLVHLAYVAACTEGYHAVDEQMQEAV